MERRIWLQTWTAAAALLLVFGSAAPGQQWARDMFSHTSHDFGTVARGSKVEHRFTFENIYLEDAHIESARVSCGCTSPEVPTQILKTWDKGEVIARVDTRSFLGQKDVTITVVFDRPFRGEVQLQIHCYIRSDVVVQPGSVQFGTVAQGAGSQRKVTVSYAGRPDWQIQRVESSNPHLTAQAVQVSRGGGMVTYDLTVNLSPKTPGGYLDEQLHLITNDPNPRAVKVPVTVEGVVQSPIAVRPSPLYMGSTAAGGSLLRELLVYGSAPFRILRVESTNPRIQCSVPTSAAATHRVPVSFDAEKATGKVYGKLQIYTDASAQPLEVSVNADVTPPAVGAEDPPPSDPAVPPSGTLPKSSPGADPPAGREI